MPPRKKKTTGPKTVEAIIHPDKRTNLPTADASEFVSDEVEAIPKLRYPRDPSLDPQLVWKGKDEQDQNPLEVPCVPVYCRSRRQGGPRFVSPASGFLNSQFSTLNSQLVGLHNAGVNSGDAQRSRAEAVGFSR